MSKRKVNHKKEELRAYEPIPSSEYREILDTYLSGMNFREISQGLNREQEAVQLIINSKIPMNYDEGGKRKPAIERLNEEESSLDPHRKPTRRDIEYLKRLKRRGRNLSECSLVLYLIPERIQQIENEYGLPQVKGRFW